MQDCLFIALLDYAKVAVEVTLFKNIYACSRHNIMHVNILSQIENQQIG